MNFGIFFIAKGEGWFSYKEILKSCNGLVTKWKIDLYLHSKILTVSCKAEKVIPHSRTCTLDLIKRLFVFSCRILWLNIIIHPERKQELIDKIYT